MLTKRLTALRSSAADTDPPAGGAPPDSGAPWAGVGGDPVLDVGALERLRELDPKGENQLLARVIKAFEASAARLLPQLQDAGRTGDLAGVRHVAHTLKSSSASVGAIKLSQMCAEIETSIRSERVEGLETRIVGMCAEMEIVLQALKRLLDANS